MQEYGRRPYGVGLSSGCTTPAHTCTSPRRAVPPSIGARSQSALEKYFESFADCTYPIFSRSLYKFICICTRSLEDLISPGLHSLCETPHQDKELTTNNTVIGIVGPGGVHEGPGTTVDCQILEGFPIEVYFHAMQVEEAPAPPASASARVRRQRLQCFLLPRATRTCRCQSSRRKILLFRGPNRGARCWLGFVYHSGCIVLNRKSVTVDYTMTMERCSSPPTHNI